MAVIIKTETAADQQETIATSLQPNHQQSVLATMTQSNDERLCGASESGDSYELTDLDNFRHSHSGKSRQITLAISATTATSTPNTMRELITKQTSLSPSPPPSPCDYTTINNNSTTTAMITSNQDIQNELDSTTLDQMNRVNEDIKPIDVNLRRRSNSIGLQSRDRSSEIKLSSQQLEHLDKLIKTIIEGDYGEFKQLVEKSRGAKRNLLNVYVDGRTALHYSLIYGRSLKWCKQLISNGANPNLTNRAGWHPIHLAAFSSSRDTMLYLIDCLSN